ncbi:hypothetical protein FRC06_003767, partial [Ceratobasidium sp. 370]
MSGGQQAYPVYLTISNISKGVRRKASKCATVVLGYLPVDNFKDVANKNLRKQLRAELLHRSMEAMLKPLKTTSCDGVPMWCTDSRVRRVYPILAAYIADFPEQNDVSGTIQSGCPACKRPFHGWGSGRMDAPLRNQADTAAAFRAYAETGNKAELHELKLRPCLPFWVDLPHVDFPSCITPDILHQLHKGVFKDYVATWTGGVLGEDTLDAHFMAMPQAKDLCHFKMGMTSVQQWTGQETKEMVKQYLPIVAEDPTVPNDFVKLVRTLLDFLYLAQSAELTESELDEMDKALRTFHQLKKVLVELKLITDLDKFDYIPKFHMLGHYTHSTRKLSTPDGYNTECPEYLHIIYAKDPWQASNQREVLQQIVDYVRRLDTIRIHHAFMDEYYGESPRPNNFNDNNNVNEEFGEESDDRESEDEGDVVKVEGAKEVSEIAYPRLSYSVAVQPTCPHIAGHHLISTYAHCSQPGLKPVVLPSDKFDMWHKLTLRHQLIPFAPKEPLCCDVVQIRPPEQDQYGHRTPSLFDTAMFINDLQAAGIQ